MLLNKEIYLKLLIKLLFHSNFSDCKANKPVYPTLKLENVFNISSAINTEVSIIQISGVKA